MNISRAHAEEERGTPKAAHLHINNASSAWCGHDVMQGINIQYTSQIIYEQIAERNS